MRREYIVEDFEKHHILMIEFWGSFNRYSLNLVRALCQHGIRLTLVSVEDCIEEPSRSYELVRIFPKFAGNGNKFVGILYYFNCIRVSNSSYIIYCGVWI